MSRDLPPIIMYARHTFCPDVARSRMRLTDLGLEWTEIDVENHPDRKQEMMAISGRPNVPTIVIGEHVLIEPSNDVLNKALVASGYSLDNEE